MKPFSTIAIPHRDVLEGKVIKDTFAADLWDVFKGRAAEYRDPDVFFRKTYLTEGIKTLLNIVEKRLKEGEGTPIIQLQTPMEGRKNPFFDRYLS
jgi:predicted AAA+ superfamily ATPase